MRMKNVQLVGVLREEEDMLDDGLEMDDDF